VCVCVCVYTYVREWVYLCVYIRTFLHACVYVYTYVCGWVYLCVYIRTFLHAWVHTDVNICILHTRNAGEFVIHKHTHSQIHKHTHSHIHIHQNTHTHMPIMYVKCRRVRDPSRAAVGSKAVKDTHFERSQRKTSSKAVCLWTPRLLRIHMPGVKTVVSLVRRTLSLIQWAL